MTRSTVRSTVTLLGISGSLREGSNNTALLRAAAALAPDDVEITIHPLHDVPLYDGDVEAAGFPPAVAAFRAAITEADGLLLASPEYNWSTSGVLKNAIDWASRPPNPPLDQKPTALLSSAGGSGGARSQRHLREILGHNDVDVLDRSVRIARGRQHVVDGELVTDEYRQQVAALVEALRDRVLERAAGQVEVA